MKKLFLGALALMGSVVPTWAGEGMWLPFLLQARESELKKSGLRLTARDLYDANQASLKDGVVHFGGFCTGEVVSHQGLILTNHHCGYDAIQTHSSLENDYLTHGFWAKNQKEEKPNPGLFVDFIKRMEDVTSVVLKNVTFQMSEADRDAEVTKSVTNHLAELKKANPNYLYSIKPIYYGLQYILIVSQRYSDVRLVGAPPSSIGKFGSDTDNWMWPRHTGDFSVFRVYASPSGSPADYDAKNIPLYVQNPLKVSLNGVKEGDFTMVYGFPGRTEEYLPASWVQHAVEELNPVRIEVRKRLLGTWDSAMRVDPAIKIAYASKYASSANAYKKWIGVNLGMERTDGLQKLEERQKANGATPDELNAALKNAAPLLTSRELWVEVAGRGWELGQLVTLVNSKDSPEQIKQAVRDFYKDYSPELDRRALKKTAQYWFNEAYRVNTALILPPNNVWDGSVDPLYTGILPQTEKSLALLESNFDKWLAEAKQDPAFLVCTRLSEWQNSALLPGVRSFSKSTATALRLHTNGFLQGSNAARMYPDANSTLRLASGKVLPYSPSDGMEYGYQTTLDGYMAKYIPGDYEFDVDPRVRALHADRNYGAYALPNGQLPVCFIASNHTSGGNSGSPALDAKGRLIGINFDRVWEGTMSDYRFDESICRNVMVDIRFVLWTIEKVGEAPHLVAEMTLVKGR